MKQITIKEVPQSFISPGITSPEEYIFGSGELRGLIIRPDGQWPIPMDKELQARNFETNACTSFGLIHSVISIFRELFGLDVNYSERFLAVASGTDPQKGGNTPQTVAETARDKGFIEESDLPFNDYIKTIDDYYAPLRPEMLKKGKEWLNKWSFKHDWLSDGSLIPPERIKDALRYSPLGVAVYAWADDGDYYFRPTGAKDIHWCEIVGYKDLEYWLIVDSYEPFVKKLAWDFKFYFSKRYYVERAKPKKNTILKSIIDFIIKWIKEIWL